MERVESGVVQGPVNIRPVSVPYTPDVEASVSTGVGSSGIAEGNKVLQLCAGRREVHQGRSVLAPRFK